MGALLRAQNGVPRTVQGMNETEATAFVELHAGATTVEPLLTPEEVAAVLEGCRIVDAEGRRIGEPGYVPTYWGTRAVVDVIDVKLARAAVRTDITVDGTTLSVSQLTKHLTDLRRSWRAKLLPGSR